MATNNGARAGVADRVGNSVEVAGEQKPPTLAQMIDRQRAEVERALPAHLKANADSYVRAAISLVKQTPALRECDPFTVLGGLMTASQLGLEFGPLGHAYLVPFGKKAQFILGYKGTIDLAWRSGKLKSIEARDVRANDHFEFSYGLESKLIHTPILSGDRGPAIAYYGVAHFKDGGHYFVVMSKDEIDAHRKRSRSSSKGPWVDDYDAMARKTVIRTMAPYLPLTTQVLRDLAQDGVVASGATARDLETETVDYADDETGEVIEADVVEDEETDAEPRGEGTLV